MERHTARTELGDIEQRGYDGLAGFVIDEDFPLIVRASSRCARIFRDIVRVFGRAEGEQAVHGFELGLLEGCVGEGCHAALGLWVSVGRWE